jgi:hypothetical protein
MLAGAAAWLMNQPGTREIVVVSDFQRGTIDSTDIALVPESVGLRFSRIAVPAESALESVTRMVESELFARIALTGSRTHVEWSERAAADSIMPWLLLADLSERDDVTAAARAAVAIGIPGAEPVRPIAVVYPRYADRRQLLRSVQPPDAQWMAHAIARMRADPLLHAATTDAAPVDDVVTADSSAAAGAVAESAFVAVARTDRGEPVAHAARGSVDGVDRLLLFVRVDAGSLASAALLAAAARAAGPEVSVDELEPLSIDDGVLASWAREPVPSASPSREASDGRWLWVLALMLIGVESWLRRRPTSTSISASTSDPTTSSSDSTSSKPFRRGPGLHDEMDPSASA